MLRIAICLVAALNVTPPRESAQQMDRRAEAMGTYFSRLHPGGSDLTSLCFLIQGLPGTVMGTDFVYDRLDQKRCEAAEWQAIRPADPRGDMSVLTVHEPSPRRSKTVALGEKLTTEGALWSLAHGLYRSKSLNGEPSIEYLVIDSIRARDYRRLLTYACAEQKGRSPRRTVLLAALAYYDWYTGSSRWRQVVAKLQSTGGGPVAKNILAVTGKLVMWHGEPSPDWERVQIWR